jgi:hypothetical protein
LHGHGFNENHNQRLLQVVQKLIPQLPTLENLLNIFVSNSQIEKAFLFDVVSKVRTLYERINDIQTPKQNVVI